jgi:hypothetical protein
MIGGWRKLHNEELYNLYSLLRFFRIIISRRTKWTGHVALMGTRECIQNFIGNPEGKKLLGRYRHRCKDIIKVDSREVGGMVR